MYADEMPWIEVITSNVCTQPFLLLHLREGQQIHLDLRDKDRL